MTWLDTEPNPYDPNSQDFQPETLPLDEIIRKAINSAAMNIRVHLPAVITEVLGNQKVNVQPLIQTRYIGIGPKNLPIIQNVMVQMPVGQGWSIKLPIKVGDTGSLIFCDRSLDVWAASEGGIVDPQDARVHDLSDPVFLPGLVPFSGQTEDNTTDMVFTNGSAILRIQADGRFKLSNDSAELLDQLVQLTTQTKDLASQADTLAETLSTDTVNTIFGPSPLNAASEYATIKSSIDGIVSALGNILTAIESLKGS